jgi:hypothetical protein
MKAAGLGVYVQLYSFFNLDDRWGKRHAQSALATGKRAGNHSTGGWVGPREGLEEAKNTSPHRDSLP